MALRVRLLRVLAAACRAGIVVLCLAWATCAEAQPSGGPALVPAQFGPKPDGIGGQWLCDGNIHVRHVSNFSTFSYLGNVTVNQTGVSNLLNQMMTPDGNEYVLTFNVLNRVTLQRRLKFDTTSHTVRFVDSFTNSGPTPQTLNVAYSCNLRQANLRLTTSSGAALPSFAAKDVGFFVPSTNPRAPALVYYVADARAALRPNVRSEPNNLNVATNFSFVVAPGKSVALVHGGGVRNVTGAENPEAIAKLFQPFLSREWIKDLPADVRKQLANRGGGSSDDVSADSLLADVRQLAEASRVELGPKSVLVMDESTQLSGVLRGEQLTVATARGSVTVPLADVAAVTGGAGQGQTPRVMLRSGEMFAGAMNDSLVLTDDSGLEVKLDPARLRALFLPAAKPAPRGESVVLLETRDGNRLTIDPQLKFTVAAAWGRLELTAARVRQLYPVRDPQPIHRVVFQDGSRLTVILQGSEFTATAPRFGSIKLTAGDITKLVTVPPTAKPREESAADTATENAAESETEGESNAARWNLVGDNVLVGTLVGSQLKLLTATGETNVDFAQVRAIEGRDAAEATWAVSLSGGNEIVGRLAEPVWRIRALGKDWTIPLRHVSSYEANPNATDAPVGARPRGPAASPSGTASPNATTPPRRGPSPADPFGAPSVDPFR